MPSVVSKLRSFVIGSLSGRGYLKLQHELSVELTEYPREEKRCEKTLSNAPRLIYTS